VFCFFWVREERTYDTVARTRNFYSAVRAIRSGEGDAEFLGIHHGPILHGLQFQSERLRRTPTTYYGVRSGIGVLFEAAGRNGPLRAGMIGLGPGTLAAYGRKGDYLKFYEINPDLKPFIDRFFTFIKDSPATVDLAVGDARLVLEREAPQNFDILVVDAFNGDSVPVHLLTREALQQYVRHLRPGGTLAIHVTNRFMKLDQLVSIQARDARLQPWSLKSPGSTWDMAFPAHWVLIPTSDEIASQLRSRGARPAVDSSMAVWTDDFADLMATLN
jgi:SAM-dependent methyltransferase